MRLHHFESLHPICPVCRATTAKESPLKLAQVTREENGHIIEGVIHCTHLGCQREFPIIDGIPIIVANIRTYIAENILAISTRRDMGEVVESLLGDCCGPDSTFNQTRHYLSSYTWDHYGDLDPAEATTEPLPGSMVRILKAGLELAGPIPDGPSIDVGCSVGRGTFVLAEHTNQLVLGIDLNFAMLRAAAQVLRQGSVSYPKRRVGIVYDRHEFTTRFAHANNVDFWACDASALPFASGAFALATSMNVLDCVPAPHELLESLSRILGDNGRLILSCPYDWSASVTPIETWLGGHSQRCAAGGSSEPLLRTLLTPGPQAGSIRTLRLIGERDDLAWHVRMHHRSVMTYQPHLVVAEKIAAG